MDNRDEVVIYAVGDVGPDRLEPASIFRHVGDVLGAGDITFCQLEAPLSHTTVPSLLDKDRVVSPEVAAAALKEAGFNVISFASNHCMEDGVEAFLETIDHLRHEGLCLIGVGRNIEEARKPTMIECKGNRIAFLGYNSIGGPEYWAQANKPGCTSLRAWTLYEPMEPTQPGTPARPRTFPYREDLAAMIRDVRNAKSQADIVVVSMHCGIHIRPVVVAEYQVDIAHAAVDAGADLVIQHHAHILKGIEVYRGKVIFYGLGNFAIEVLFMTKEWAELPEVREARKALNPDWHPPYPDYPSFPFPPDSRKTIVAKCVVSNKLITSVSFLPSMINQESQPDILPASDERCKEVIDYVDLISREAGFSTTFKIDGAEVLIAT